MAQTAVDIVVNVLGDQKLKRLSTETSKLDNALKKAQGSLNGAVNGITKTDRAARGAQAGMRGLIGVVGKLAAAYGALRVAQSTAQSGIQRAESERRIKFLAREYGEANALQREATAAAKKFGESQTVANKALADTFARLRPIGTSLSDIVSVYNGFNTAARISGSSAVEASNAFRQLSQALGSGALRGDEFNSIAEQVPGVLTAISKETGIAQGKLRDYAAEGKITANVVIRALKRIEREGADQLAEALNGPEQAIKDLQIAGEELQVAFAETIIPEISTAFRELAVVIKELEGPLRFIGGLLSNTLKEARLTIQALKGQGDAINTLRAGKLPFFGAPGANEQLEGFFGKERLKQLKDDARKAADALGISYSEALKRRLIAALKVIDATPEIRKRIEKRIQDEANAASIGGGDLDLTTPTKSKAPTKKDDLAAIAQLAYGPQIIAAARANNLDPRLLAGLVKVESGFNANAVSSAGAAGLTQLMKGTAGDLGVRDRFNPVQNLMGGAKYLKQMLEMFGSLPAALRAYNQGPGNQQRFPGGVSQEAVQYPGKVLSAAKGFGFGGQGIADADVSAFQALLDLEEERNQKLQERQELLRSLAGEQLVEVDRVQQTIADYQQKNQLLQLQVDKGKEFADTTREINRLVMEGVAFDEAYRLVSANQELQKLLEGTQELNQIQELAGSISDTLEGGIVGGLTTAIDALVSGADDLDKKLKQIAQGVLADIGQQLIKFGISSLFKGIGGGGPGGIFDGLFRAEGGPVAGGKPYIVGEKGPELFIPGITGTVSNNDQFEAAREAMSSGSGGSSEAFAENADAIAVSNSYTRERMLERERSESVTSSGSMLIETQVINNVEYASVEQVEQATALATKQARAQVFSDMKNRPAIRRQVGLK